MVGASPCLRVLPIMSTRPPRRNLTIIECAESAHVSRATVYREIAAGRLVSIRIRGRRLIRPRDHDRWLDSGVAR